MARFNIQSVSIIPRTQIVNRATPATRPVPPGGVKRLKLSLTKEVETLPPHVEVTWAGSKDIWGNYFPSGSLNGKPSYTKEDGSIIYWIPLPPTLEENPGFWTIAGLYDSNIMDANNPNSNIWNVFEWFITGSGILPTPTVTAIGLQ